MNPIASASSRVIDQLLKELEEKKAAVAAMGGREQVKKQHARGKLTVPENSARIVACPR